MTDLWRHYGKANWPLLLWAVLHNRTFAPVATLRWHAVAKRLPRLPRSILLPFVSLLHRWTQQRAGLDLPAGIHAGPGLRITHGWGLVVSRNAILGSNVTLMHGVTLGGKNDRFPIIGSNVFIGAHAILLGGVRVGDGAVIGPGSVIVHDVQAGTTVVGNPQREVGTVDQPMGKFLFPSQQ